MKSKETMTVYKLAEEGFGGGHCAVDYAPGNKSGEFYLSSGDARNGNGTYLTALEALSITWRGDLDAAGASWLVPILERIAGGETVSPEQMFQAYRAQHGGQSPQREQWPKW